MTSKNRAKRASAKKTAQASMPKVRHQQAFKTKPITLAQRLKNVEARNLGGDS